MENTEETPKPKPARVVKRARRKGKTETDANFIQESRVFRKMFTDRLADFTAKDPSLNSGFADEWLKTITLAEDQPTDELMKDKIQEKVDDIEEFTKQVLDYITDLEYYVGKAFPDDERIPYEFAFDLIKKETQNTSTKLLIHCYATITVATDYSTELLAANMPANLIADFSTFIDPGARLYMDLEVAKRYRIRATSERVKLYNQLHSFWLKVSRAAAVIYKNQPEVAGMWNR